MLQHAACRTEVPVRCCLTCTWYGGRICLPVLQSCLCMIANQGTRVTLVIFFRRPTFSIHLRSTCPKKPIIINTSDALARGRWRLPKAGTREPICRSTYCDYVYTQGDVTSRELWSRYDRHFVGRPITCMTHNVMRDVNGRRFTVLFEQN